jgi:hypothetical protein
MKNLIKIILILALMAFPLRMAYPESLAEWLIKPGGSPPVITHSFAVEKLSHGDTTLGRSTWRLKIRMEICGQYNTASGKGGRDIASDLSSSRRVTGQACWDISMVSSVLQLLRWPNGQS